MPLLHSLHHGHLLPWREVHGHQLLLRKCVSTVFALLFPLQDKYMIFLEKPSMHPCTTSFHLKLHIKSHIKSHIKTNVYTEICNFLKQQFSDLSNKLLTLVTAIYGLWGGKVPYLKPAERQMSK